MKKTRFADLVSGVLFVILGIAVYFGANNLQKVKLGIGPGGFPKVISVFMMILGLCMIISVLLKGMPKPEFRMEKKSLLLLATSIALCLLYAAVVDKVGFLISTTILLYAMILLFGTKEYIKAAIISVLFTVAVWLLFTKVFMIFLPACRLFR